MKSFPGTELIMINKLWTNYSHGKFGFSIQKKIYESILNAFQDMTKNREAESIAVDS
ncbi:MAG TPA: hypothetical protein DEG17_19350 [Cyanobacteria bacterium UBA11149]|nr:hypothetical protein [Cyanobacteria bacterium UBA11367]HBE57892.1 hypothetical protein [Cyanobacteria bacterium UBA11366]HBK65643.1 hypothetical protein [Cyanobacteria bacterium UBA11166]HBR74854.1 hypothetical protein [Cyanobacteria bacterium UBA11159]HBS69064.1 hypothetical protein [Cyanobacteria bacterium UBA11153]HBW90961.1 hypothetical protein [Cyanobacteria bacterium UBA11149]HCA95045.1 hypothetical protein [Cyanobacteria bacterium UBA9226]